MLSTGANTTTSRSSRRVADANGPRLELGTRGGAKATDGPLAFRHGESAPRAPDGAEVMCTVSKGASIACQCRVGGSDATKLESSFPQRPLGRALRQIPAPAEPHRHARGGRCPPVPQT